MEKEKAIVIVNRSTNISLDYGSFKIGELRIGVIKLHVRYKDPPTLAAAFENLEPLLFYPRQQP